MQPPIGIIAGSGDFPLILARSIRHTCDSTIVAAAFDGETSLEIESLADAVEWVKVGQLNKLINVFTSRGITRAIMAGGIAPSNLFKDLRLDLRAMTAIARLKERNAETIFGAVVEEMGKDGVELLDPRPFLGENVPAPGILTKRKPDEEQQQDIAFGLRIAKEVSRLDIGQTVVVKKGTVLAVEGLEGTDRCMTRGGKLAGEKGGAVVIKVAKPNHDFRFDIPCVGLRTVETAAQVKISVLAMEAGRTLLLNREKVLAAANQAGLRIVAVKSS